MSPTRPLLLGLTAILLFAPMSTTATSQPDFPDEPAPKACVDTLREVSPGPVTMRWGRPVIQVQTDAEQATLPPANGTLFDLKGGSPALYAGLVARTWAYANGACAGPVTIQLLDGTQPVAGLTTTGADLRPAFTQGVTGDVVYERLRGMVTTGWAPPTVAGPTATAEPREAR